MTPILITPPAIEPVTLAEMKTWLRIDTADDDSAISALIVAARLTVESTVRRMLLNQSWRLVLDAWPQDNIVRVPLAPFQNVLAVRVYDATGTPQLLGPALWTLDANPEGARLLFTLAPPPPGRTIAGIEIDLALGYGATPASVPEPMRQAIRMLAARWYENRGENPGDSGGTHLPASVAALLAPFRRTRLS